MLTEEEYQKLDNIIQKVNFTAPNQGVEFKKIRDNLYHLLMMDNGRINMQMVRI